MIIPVKKTNNGYTINLGAINGIVYASGRLSRSIGQIDGTGQVGSRMISSGMYVYYRDGIGDRFITIHEIYYYYSISIDFY